MMLRAACRMSALPDTLIRRWPITGVFDLRQHHERVSRLQEFTMPIDLDCFNPTSDELEALKRLAQEAVQIDTGVPIEPPERLVELGFVTWNASGTPALTARGLALVRHRP